MNRSQLLLLLFLFCFVGALWLLAFGFPMVPAHARDPLGTQTVSFE